MTKVSLYSPKYFLIPKIQKVYLVLIIVCFPLLLWAQTDDNILWAKLGIQKTISPKTTLIFAPIVRLNKDISEYQNLSLDYTIRYKLNNTFAFQLSGRTWFIPNGTNRQFIWPDLLFRKKYQKWQISSRLRWHYAIDFEEILDPDFIRWNSTFSWLDFGKLKLDIGVEPWFRLNSFKELQRIRYITGIQYKFSDQYNLSLHLWRQESINIQPPQKVNIFMLEFSYSL